MNTPRSYPRTMQQAFGPHTDDTLYEPSEAVFKSWLEWRRRHAVATNSDDYQADEIAANNTMEIPR